MLKRSTRKRIPQAPHPFLTGIAAGLIAGAAAGQSERFLDRFVSREQKKRDRKVREASAHQMAGPHFARKLYGRKLDEKEKKQARAAFGVAYGVCWGLIYTGLSQEISRISRWAGLPFAIPFFFACDGTMAPLLGVSPDLTQIPWQPSAKEMGNHIVWTAAAEMVHRGASRLGR